MDVAEVARLIETLADAWPSWRVNPENGRLVRTWHRQLERFTYAVGEAAVDKVIGKGERWTPNLATVVKACHEVDGRMNALRDVKPCDCDGGWRVVRSFDDKTPEGIPCRACNGGVSKRWSAGELEPKRFDPEPERSDADPEHVKAQVAVMRAALNHRNTR